MRPLFSEFKKKALSNPDVKKEYDEIIIAHIPIFPVVDIDAEKEFDKYLNKAKTNKIFKTGK